MRALRRPRFLRHVVIPLTLMAWLSGCHKWGTTGMAPGQVVRENPDRVRVRIARAIGGDPLILESPRVEGDSLIGLMAGTGERRAIPIGEIQRLEIRESHPGGTVGLVLGGVVVIGLGVLAVLSSFEN